MWQWSLHNVFIVCNFNFYCGKKINLRIPDRNVNITYNKNLKEFIYSIFCIEFKNKEQIGAGNFLSMFVPKFTFQSMAVKLNQNRFQLNFITQQVIYMKKYEEIFPGSLLNMRTPEGPTARLQNALWSVDCGRERIIPKLYLSPRWGHLFWRNSPINSFLNSENSYSYSNKWLQSKIIEICSWWFRLSHTLPR